MTGTPQGAGPLLAGYARVHPDRFALAIARGGVDAAGDLLSDLPDDVRPSVVVNMPPTHAAELIAGAPDGTLADWLSCPDLDAAVRIARRIPDPRYGALADRLDRRRRRLLDSHRSFRGDIVGAHIETHVSCIRNGATVAEAVSLLDSRKPSPRIPLLVLNSSDHFVGWFDPEEALRKGPAARAGDCARPSDPVRATLDLRAARAAFESRAESWLPVVDASGRFVGVLRRSRLPAAVPPATTAGALLPILATEMFELLAELPALLNPDRRTS